MARNYKKPVVNTEQRLQVMSDQLDRLRLAGNLGLSYGGDRDLYSILGYTKNPTPDDFWQMYRRQDVASRIVNAFPQATWRGNPKIVEGDEETETAFEKEIQALDDDLKIWAYCERADRLCGIGRYSILILGVDDGAQLSEPLTNANQINWFKAVPERHADVSVWNQDVTSPNFGKPEVYSVTFGSADVTSLATTVRPVHHSRVIHIAEFLEEDEVFGVPRLESVYNRLQDLEKVVGGSAEMFWLGARNGLKMTAAADANLSPDEISNLSDMAADYQHGLRRTLAAQGVDIESLGGNYPDPASNASVLLDLIAGSKGMPKRILIGSERGELASGQDENNWMGRIDERRINFAEPTVIRPLLTRLIDLGVITGPKGVYRVEWDADDGLSEMDKAEIGKLRSESLSNYANAIGSDIIVPVEEFREVWLGLEPEPNGGFPTEPMDLGVDDEPLTPEEAEIVGNAEVEVMSPFETALIGAISKP